MYRYRCGTCAASSPPVRTLGEVYAARDRHRDDAHAGLTPDGEQILRAPQPPGAPDWRIAAAVLAGAALALLDWLIRHL